MTNPYQILVISECYNVKTGKAAWGIALRGFCFGISHFVRHFFLIRIEADLQNQIQKLLDTDGLGWTRMEEQSGVDEHPNVLSKYGVFK